MFDKIIIFLKELWRSITLLDRGVLAVLKRVLRNKSIGKNFLLFLVGLGILIFGSGVIWVFSFQIPDFSSFEERKIVNSTKIYDRTGKVVLYDIHRDIRRTSIPYEEMGANIKNATVAVEDAEFWNHKGIRITSIIRAGFANVLGIGRTQGGSTITQQLVKNTLLNPKKTFGRKLKEWVLALKVERALPKEKILELYLNEVPYGGTIYGIEEAARSYFDKAPADLSIAEAAYLAAIPQSPTYLSPYGKHKDKLEERKNFVLYRMNELGFISEEEYEEARSREVAFLAQTQGSIRAPHFVFFIKSYLEQKYGTDMVENGGLRVLSTLDYDLQKEAEEIVKEGALQNEKNWSGSNAGLVAIDPKTGQILTMVGSRDYFDENIDGNYNVATAERQPGSSFKPFIYAEAFNKGYTPDSILFDVRTEFQTTCDWSGVARAGRSQGDCYHPENYDGQNRGPMTLRNALGQSINVPAVKLLYLVGIRNALRLAEAMGISTLVGPERYGLTLVIGGGEVTLLDMTSAYGTFATGGVHNPSTPILSIMGANGKVLEEFTPSPKEVLPQNTALTVSDILSDNVARTPTFGAASPLLIPGRDVAAKTGTTNNNRDAWTIGYTPSISVGVWVGNNDNKPMKKGGVSLAGPIWNKFMSRALKSLPGENFQTPNLEVGPDLKPFLRGFWQGGESFVVDKISGKLATEDTPPESKEERVITNVHSELFWIDKTDPTGSPPADPSRDPQYQSWEASVQSWWATNRQNYQTVSGADKPNLFDDIHGPGKGPQISVLLPGGGSYRRDERIEIKVSSFGSNPAKKIDVFVNDTYLGSSEGLLQFSFIPEELENLREENELRVVAYDALYNRSEVVSSFRVE